MHNDEDGEKIKVKKLPTLTPNGTGGITVGGGIIGIDAVFAHMHPVGMLVAAIGTWVFSRHTTDMIYLTSKVKSHFIVTPEDGQGDGQSLTQRFFGMSQSSEQVQPKLPQEKKGSSILKRFVSGPSQNIVDLGPNLQLDIHDIAGKAVCICGIRRSGKTTLGVRIAEELSKFNMPMFIPDLKGDWLSCVDTLPNAVILRQGDITSNNAQQIGYSICENDLQVILDVASFNDMSQVAVIITNVIDGIFLWEKKHPQNKKLCAVYLDEAQSYLPQDVKDSIIPNPAARDAMMNAYMLITAIGGSLGLFPIILTQRLAQVAKKIVAQSELNFILRQTNDNDLNRCTQYTDVSKDKIRALKQGTGVYVNLEGISSIHSFHKRLSDDAMSRTPQVNVSQKSTKSTIPVKAPVIEEYEDLPDLWEGDEDEEEEEELLIPNEKVVKYQPARSSTSQFASEDDRKVKRAHKFWQEGHSSVRKLEAVSGWSNGETRRVIRLMRERKLVK